MAEASQLLLMLDYDGTLVPIAPTPDQARPDAELVVTLQKLTISPGRVVGIISGRKLAELQNLLPLTGLYLFGSHGLEFRDVDGRVHCMIEDQSLVEHILSLEKVAGECISNNSGFLLENKGASLALHYRLADPPLAREVLCNFIQKVACVMDRNRFEFLPGKKVLEIRPRGVSKGKAVQYLCRKHPGALPLYIGDDRTDEDGFLALKRGLGILVSPQPRPSAATFRLTSPREVYKFLFFLLQGSQ
ncbi:trehalose-phosphatase [Desulfofundulus sp.]|uniref:trehalose-phosphatase n=1 Tax=Desulfofundulus sp. TaxID=2282750 RepID=UPI003C742802